MSFEDRTALYQQIEQIRNRPLIAYVTSNRQNASAMISSDVIIEFTRQIDAIAEEHKEIDLLIVSEGGDPTVSWRIVSLLRERFNRFNVLLPYFAYSAATLISLGADEIVMHPYSNLGPVDPQLTTKRRVQGPNGQDHIENVAFGSEDLKSFIEYARKDIGISDQEQLAKAFELVCREVGTIPIGVARRGSQLALAMGEQLLSLHMDDQNKAKAIAESLNTSFYHHGYPLGPSEVRKIGLPVIKPEKDLQDLLWAVWNDIEREMECGVPFDPVRIIMSDAVAGPKLSAAHLAQIPVDLPPPVLNQAYNNVLANIQVEPAPTVDVDLFYATVESSRCKSDYRAKLRLIGVRLPDLNIQLSVNKLSEGWKMIPI